MADPFNPYPIYNPANITGYNNGYIPSGDEFLQALFAFFGNQRGLPRPIANSFPVGYRAEPVNAILSGPMTSPLLAGSRNYVYDLDQEAFSRNLSMIVGKTISSLGLNLTDDQMKSVWTAANYLAMWGPQAIEIAENLLAKDGQDAGWAKQVVSALNTSVSSLYGSGGSRVPLYSAYSSLAQNVPLDQRDAMLMGLANRAFPAGSAGNLWATSGFSNKQTASLLAAAASFGNNVLNVDTDLTRELALRNLYSFDSNTLTTDNPVIRRMAEVDANRNFAKLGEAGTISQAIYRAARDSNYGTNSEDRIAASRQFSQFFNIVNRVRGIEGFEGKTPSTFKGLINMRGSIKELADKAKNTKRRAQLNSIVSDIDAMEKAVAKDVQDMDVYSVMNTVRQDRRARLTSAVQGMGIFNDDFMAQTDFVEAMSLRDELTSYGIRDVDLLANDEIDKDGVKTGRKLWQVAAADPNTDPEVKRQLEEYYTRYHDTYVEGKKSFTDKFGTTKIEWITNFLNADENERARLLKTQEGQDILNSLDAEAQADLVMGNQRQLTKAGSIISAALTANGTPIEDPTQLADFMNKITYGGMGTMTTEAFNDTMQQIGVGMLRSGANGNVAMQLAGRGAQAALAVGGDAQSGAIYGLEAGLTMGAIAKTKRWMDPTRAQEIGMQAGARATKSLVFQAYNAIGDYIGDRKVDANNPYKTLIEKIQRNENLTTEELDTLFRDSGKIMTSIGMSANEQVSALNKLYRGGAMTEAATRNATAWMLNSTTSRDVMKSNIRTRIGNDDFLTIDGQRRKLSEDQRKSLSNAIVNNLGNIDSLDWITNSENQEELRAALLKDVTDPEVRNLIKSMDAAQLQRVTSLALQAGANSAGTDIQSFLYSIRGSAGYADANKNNAEIATILQNAPDVAKAPWQNVINALTSEKGTFKDVLTAMTTAISAGNLNADQQKQLFSDVALMSVLDKKYAGTTKLSNEATEKTSKTIRNLYKMAGNDPKNMAIINKFMSGQELTERESKYIDSLMGNLSLDEVYAVTQAQNSLKTAAGNVEDEFRKPSKPETQVNRSHTITPLEAEEVPAENAESVPPQDKADEVPVAPAAGGAAGGASKDKGKKKDDSDSADRDTASGGKKRDGSSEGQALFVQVVQPANASLKVNITNA